MLAQSFAAFDTSPGNPTGDASSPQIGTAALVVAAFVLMQLRQPLAYPPSHACNDWNRIHALLEQHGVVPVGSADEDHQWDASGIYDDMSFGAELASVGWIEAHLLALRGLAPRSHLCLLGSNQSGHARADVPA